MPAPPRPRRDLLRARHPRTCARCSRPRTPPPTSSRCCPRAPFPTSPRLQGTDAAEIGSVRRPRHRPLDRDLRARQPRQGCGRPGGAEREPRARARRDRRAAPLGGSRLMAVAVARTETATGAVTAAKGFAAGAVHAGIRRSRLDLAVVRSTVPAVGAGDVHRQPGAGRARARLEGAPRERPAAGGRDQLRRRERGDRQAGRARRARDRSRGGRVCSASIPSRCSSSPPA